MKISNDKLAEMLATLSEDQVLELKTITAGVELHISIGDYNIAELLKEQARAHVTRCYKQNKRL